MTNDRNESPNPSGENSGENSCGDREAHLGAYVLGELDVLSGDERAGLEAHLESCERCREEEALLRRTVEAVAQASGASASVATPVLESDRRDAVLGEAAEAVMVSSKEKLETVKPEAVSDRAAAASSQRRGPAVSGRVSSTSVFVRRLSWVAAAAVIVAAGAIPFFVDETVPSRGEPAGAAGEVAFRSTADGGVGPGAAGNAAARSMRSSLSTTTDYSVTELSAGSFPVEVELTAEGEPGPISGAPVADQGVSVVSAPTPAPVAARARPASPGVLDMTGVNFDLDAGAVEDERRAKRGSTRRGELSEEIVLGRGITPDGEPEGAEATGFGRAYSTNRPIPGSDGVIVTVEDRVLLAGSGVDGRFAGAEPAAPTAEILLPPNVIATRPVAESESLRLAFESQTQAKDAGSSTQSVEARVELGSGRGGREGKPASAGETPLGIVGTWSIESAAPSPSQPTSETRGRSRALSRSANISSRSAVREEMARAEDSYRESIRLGTSGRRKAESEAADGGVEDSFGRQPPTLALESLSGKPTDELALLSEDLESLHSLKELEALQEKALETLREDKAFKDALNMHKHPDYFYKKFEDATKADEQQKQQAQQAQQAQPNKRVVELTKLVETEPVESGEPENRAVLNLSGAFTPVPVEQPAVATPPSSAAPPSSATRPMVDAKKLVEEYCQRLAPRSEETPDMMFFRYWGTNPFVEANVDNLSTFAVDVDTASYTLMRKYLTDRGVLPPREAIRTEEFVNYFDYEYAPPAEGQTFAVHTEMAPSPFGHEPEYQLLEVGVKGREVTSEKRKPCALVFVVDTSGSMARESRLELVKDGLRLLVREVDEGDTIGIVAFDRTARTILEPTPADQKERILDAINTLQSRRNTNVDAGLKMGYEMAAANLAERATNRVLLLSDGVANTGVTDVDGMLANVKAQRQRGIFLTCVGVGMGNHNDTLLEQLADRGDGQCVYVDRLEEARKVFVENLAGTLETIARDVKIQVEFDREKVLRYRLLGYENRAVADSAFRDDTVDAGEVGAGHEVTAVYELKCAPRAEGRIATVRVRHLKVDSREPVELEHVVDTASRRGTFADTSARFKLGALAGEFAEILRGSYWARGSDPARVAAMTQDLLGEGGMKLGADPEVVELAALMHRTAPLIEARRTSEGELAQVMDALKENTHLRTRVETLRLEESEENTQYLRNLQEQNEELRRRLERLLDRRVSR